MNTGLIVILIVAILGIGALVVMRRRKASDTDGRYLIERSGIPGLHVNPSIPRATAEQMADLMLEVHREVWPVIQLAYRAACAERKVLIASLHGRWHTTLLEPARFADGRWTAYGVSAGQWALAVGCPVTQLAEEFQSIARSALGDDVYDDHDLYRDAGETVSRWIRERWGSA